MNTAPQSPQEEREMRVTALLLGQLTGDEVAALRQEMERDPALKLLHDRLHRTIGLVREASANSEDADSIPAERLTLSADRRARLLASFKTIQPQELARQKKRQVQRRELMLVAAMLAGLMGVGSVMVTWNQPKARAAIERPALLAIRPEQTVEEEFAAPAQPEGDAKPTSGRMRNWFFAREEAGKEVTKDEHKLHGSEDRPATPAPAPPTDAFWDTGSAGAIGGRYGLALSSPASEPRAAGRLEVAGSGRVGLHEPVPLLEKLSDESGRKALDDIAFAGRALEKKAATESTDARGARVQIAATPTPSAPPATALADVAAQTVPSRGSRAGVRSINEGEEGLVRQLAEQMPVAGPASAGQEQRLSSALAPASKPIEERPLARFKSPAPEQNLPAASTLDRFGSAAQSLTDLDSTSRTDLGTVFNQSRSLGANQTVAGKNYSAFSISPATDLPVDQKFRSSLGVEAKLAPSQFAPTSNNSVSLGYFNSVSVNGAQAATRPLETRFDDQSRTEDFIIRDPQQIGILTQASTAAKAEAAPAKEASLWAKFRNALTPEEAQRAKEDLVNNAIADGANLSGRRGQGLRAETDQLKSAAKTDSTAEVNLAELQAKVAAAQVELRLTRDRFQMAGALQEQQQLAARDEAELRTKLKQVEAVSQEQKQSDPAPVRRPAPNAATPQPEIITAENAFSTFSLNVSDVSFKLAAASLEKNQMPDAASVRTEEFINAFDYRDPEPTGNRPLAFHWERARYPFAHNRDLVRLSVKTAASGRQPGRPLNLVLLLDNSGSMERADRIRIRQECLRVLATQLEPSDRVSVVAFARTPRLWVDGLPGSQAGELAGRVGQLAPDGGTNLEEAMNLAYQTARRYFQASGINRVVLLTDGAANLGDVEPDSLRRQVEAQRQQGVALDCFGIGWDGYNDDLLEVLSRNGDGRYGFINTPEAAATEFAGQLAGALRVAASDVKVQVQFNPRRVTAHRQMGYAKHQLTKEQFRDNTVDAAEIGAAEAGNALYVVEVNPAGEGPLGVARVRFKLPGTSDYREQEWTLAYEGQAKGFDQAAPSLRLAGVAAAFSEWLVSSPFAAEVTPSGLQGYLTGVSSAFGNQPRPQQLEIMLRQAGGLAGK